MPFRHRRTLGLGVALLAATWLAAWGGYRWALSRRMTAARVREYVVATDLARLDGEARRRALEELARRINALSPDERRRMRLERAWETWFQTMTEAERSTFIEATLPTGFRQMMTAFERLPESRRRQAVDQAVRRMREARETLEQDGVLTPEAPGTNAPPVLSTELQHQAVTLGLRAYYGESSAQTKAEVAPLIEELQQAMESGRMFRGPRPHD